MPAMTRIPLFLAVVSVLCAGPADAQKKIREKPSEATLACGSEIRWQDSIAGARALLLEAGIEKPVFWYVPTVQGSPMDRKPEVDLYMMAGPFASEEVATLLKRKFVSVKEVASGEWQEKYGLKPMSFIEPGFLVLAPDGTEILKIDRITTLSAEWFVWQLRSALRMRPDLDQPSPEVVQASDRGGGAALAEALLAEGDAAGAWKALAPEGAGAASGSDYLRGRILVGLRKADDARPRLEAAIRAGGPDAAAARVELARLLLREGRAAEAAEAFAACAREASPRQHEARFLHGVCLRLTQQDEPAHRIWKELALAQPASRWSRKASAEAQRLGPFSRAFERFDWLPEDAFLEKPAGTCRPREEKDAPAVARRGVELLLQTQKADGSWDDSYYDFGGTDSLPNVYAAGTALAALALVEWREADPARCDAAVKKALAWLADEKHLAYEDKDEIVWAHAYRLLLWERLLRGKHEGAGAARKKAIEVVQQLLQGQLKNGGWRHEYPNPFATATVLHALARVGAAGVPVNKDAIAKAAAALGKSRGEDGSFAYGQGGAGSPPEFSAGRAPICELALLLAGASDQKRLAAAVELSFEQHRNLENVRKYDDHADRYRNGGFFFWYALFGRLEAINALEDPALRARGRERLRATVLAIPEIDGGFVDSHELGRTYGTAMALLCLIGTEADKP